jgi:probable H4MPT-linked C1 transfer pathway protein
MLTLLILALDVGGVNIKAASIKVGEPHRLLGFCTHYFPIWKFGKEKLFDALNRVNKTLGLECDTVALTMTAELSDAYQTKREGVEHIVDTVQRVYRGKPIYVLNTSGSFLDPESSIKSPLEVAGANWVATAWLAGKLLSSCVMIDVGSTTTDIIPVVKGRVAAKGKTDLERLQSGELVYTGALRTNLAALARRVPVNGVLTPLSAEYFASTGDVHLILKHISEDEFTVETADGRGRSLGEAYARLARIVCADVEMLSKETLDKIAKYLYKVQLKQIVDALKKVLTRLEEKGVKLESCLTLGIGRRFLAKPAAAKLGLRAYELSDLTALKPSIPETAVALGWLLASNLGGDAKLCM